MSWSGSRLQRRVVPGAAAAPGLNISLHLQRENVFSTSQPTSNQQKQYNNSNNNNGGLFGENCTAGALPRDQRKSFPFIRYSIYRDDGYILHKRYPGEREKVPGAICMDYKATQSLSLNLLTAQQRGEEEEEGGSTYNK